MDEPVVEVETSVTATPEAIWVAMTTRKSPMFMGATMETDWQPGSKYTLSGEWNGNAFTDYGAIETSVPGKELVFTHWSKTPEPPASFNAVRVRIAPEGGSSKVTLAQLSRGEPKSFDDTTKAEFRKTWAMMLDGLKSAAEAK